MVLVRLTCPGLLVAAAKPSGPSSASNARPPVPGGGGPSVVSSGPTASGGLGGGPQLGGLFANGMPTLRKTPGAAVDTGRGQGWLRSCFPEHR